jgi:hypothetical protein
MIAPMIINAIETNRTTTRIACITFVFYILLNEKAAPKIKKTDNQK